MRRVKKKGSSDTEQSIATRRRLGCLLGCLSIIFLILIILTLTLYLVLHTLKEPPADSFLVPETRMIFFLNFDVDSPPFRTFLWRLLRAYYATQKTEITYQEFTTQCNLLRFFFYPKVVILLQEREGPPSLSSSVIINFRRAIIVFRYLLRKVQKDSIFPDWGKENKELNYAFVKGSLIISDEFSAQEKIINRRKGIDKRPVSEEIKRFAVIHSRIKRPEYLLTGFLDNNDSWIGRYMRVLARITPGETQSNILKDFFSHDEWSKVRWGDLKKSIIRLKLTDADTFHISIELYFKDSTSVMLIEPILRETILPLLKDLLSEEFVITYDMYARDSMLIISLQLKQTAEFFQSLFQE